MYMELTRYLTSVRRAEIVLADAYRRIQRHHGDLTEVCFLCGQLAGLSEDRVNQLEPFLSRHSDECADLVEPPAAKRGARNPDSTLGIRHDLQALCLMAEDVISRWTTLLMAAQSLDEARLVEVAMSCVGDAERQIRWLQKRILQPSFRVAVAG
jgi:hypothetical protein